MGSFSQFCNYSQRPIMANEYVRMFAVRNGRILEERRGVYTGYGDVNCSRQQHWVYTLGDDVALNPTPREWSELNNSYKTWTFQLKETDERFDYHTVFLTERFFTEGQLDLWPTLYGNLLFQVSAYASDNNTGALNHFCGDNRKFYATFAPVVGIDPVVIAETLQSFPSPFDEPDNNVDTYWAVIDWYESNVMGAIYNEALVADGYSDTPLAPQFRINNYGVAQVKQRDQMIETKERLAALDIETTALRDFYNKRFGDLQQSDYYAFVSELWKQELITFEQHEHLRHALGAITSN